MGAAVRRSVPNLRGVVVAEHAQGPFPEHGTRRVAPHLRLLVLHLFFLRAGEADIAD